MNKYHIIILVFIAFCNFGNFSNSALNNSVTIVHASGIDEIENGMPDIENDNCVYENGTIVSVNPNNNTSNNTTKNLNTMSKIKKFVIKIN